MVIGARAPVEVSSERDAGESAFTLAWKAVKDRPRPRMAWERRSAVLPSSRGGARVAGPGL